MAHRSLTIMPCGCGPVELLHPATGNSPSGGHVYNRRLLEAAGRHGFPLSSQVVQRAEVGSRFQEEAPALRIWDGLFLEEIARHGRLARRAWGLLLHWLPSQDPAISPALRRRLETAERVVVESAALVIVSGSALGIVLGRRHPHRRFAVCEPGVADAFLARRSADPRTVRPTVELLTVANMLPAKGLADLLPTLARLGAPAWRWHIVGDRGIDPVCTRRFEAAAARLGLARRIHHHGVLSQAAIAARMDHADLFVFPSRFEAYGMALAEAATRALPAVSMRVGAAGTLFRHGVDGLLARAGDIDEFGAHLRRLAQDRALRARFRANLRRRRARTWDDTLADFATALASADAAFARSC